MTPSQRLIYKVAAEDAGQRLDRWLKRMFPHLPHSLLEKYLRRKDIRVNSKKATTNTRLNPDDIIDVYQACLTQFSSPPDLTPSKLSSATHETAQALPSWVLYQDDFFLVLNKPQGLATQGGTGLITSVDQALSLWLGPQDKKGFLVHRLDKDTSGLLLIAFTPHMAKKFGELLIQKEIQKTYWALSVEAPSPPQGYWTHWMAKRPGKEGEKMEIVLPDTLKALRASCHYRTLERQEDLTLVELNPETGRTHQLRLQMATQGCPILGDGKYGGRSAHPKGRTSLHLHAMRLAFPHPSTQKLFQIEAPLPSHFQNTLEAKGFKSVSL